MAQTAGNQKFCKLVHTENGRTWTRRIHSMMVQARDGKLHYLSSGDLPDSISLYTGVPYSGAHAADVLLSPKSAPGKPFLPVHTGVVTKRDAFFLVLGMFAFRVIASLADAAAFALG